MGGPFVMHESIAMIPGADFKEANGEFALSARGALKVMLCTTRAEVKGDEPWIRLRRFQEHVAGMLAARAAITGNVDVDKLLEDVFVPKIRAAGLSGGADAFMTEVLRVLDDSAVSS